MKEKKFFNSFQKSINETIKVKKSLINSSEQINKSIKIMTKVIQNGGKVMLCGNGGSAADAQHLAAEFLIRLRPKVNRNPLPMISLATDTSTLTACGNDYNFSKIFSRPFEALSKEKDLLLVISTSGNSKNIIEVVKYAKSKKIKTIGFSGFKGGYLKRNSNISVHVNSQNYGMSEDSHHILMHLTLQYLIWNLKKKKN